MCLERFLRQTRTLSNQTLSDQTHTLSDQTLSDQTQTLSESDDDVWRLFEQMLQQQSSSHTHTHSQPLVLLLDDNFYYQSMRYQIHQLARKCMYISCVSEPGELNSVNNSVLWCLLDRRRGLLPGVPALSAACVSPEEPAEITERSR